MRRKITWCEQTTRGLPTCVVSLPSKLGKALHDAGYTHVDVELDEPGVVRLRLVKAEDAQDPSVPAWLGDS